MAAGSFTLYSNAALEIGEGAIDLASDSFYMVLLTNAYVPAANSDSTYANVSADELASGSGYTAGVKLTGVAWTLAGGTCTFTCAAPQWTGFSGTFRYCAVVRSASGTGLAAADKLLCYCDCSGGGSIAGGGGTLTITPNAGGVFTLTHSP